MKPAVRLPAFGVATITGATFGPSGVTIDASERVTVPIGKLDETQGWIALRMIWGWSEGAEPEGGTGFPFLFDWRDDADNRLGLFFSEQFKVFGMYRAASATGGSADVAATAVAGVSEVVIGRWTAATVATSRNGGAFTSAANTAIPTLSASVFDVGSSEGNAQIDSTFAGVLWGAGTLRDEDAGIIRWALESGQPNPARLLPESARVLGWWDCRSATYRVAG